MSGPRRRDGFCSPSVVVNFENFFMFCVWRRVCVSMSLCIVFPAPPGHRSVDWWRFGRAKKRCPVQSTWKYSVRAPLRGDWLVRDVFNRPLHGALGVNQVCVVLASTAAANIPFPILLPFLQPLFLSFSHLLHVSGILFFSPGSTGFFTSLRSPAAGRVLSEQLVIHLTVHAPSPTSQMAHIWLTCRAHTGPSTTQTQLSCGLTQEIRPKEATPTSLHGIRRKQSAWTLIPTLTLVATIPSSENPQFPASRPPPPSENDRKVAKCKTIRRRVANTWRRLRRWLIKILRQEGLNVRYNVAVQVGS